jgi:hypothetical protein
LITFQGAEGTLPIPSPQTPCEAFSSPQRFWDLRLQRFPPLETFLPLPASVSLMLFTLAFAVWNSKAEVPVTGIS